jgi:hypothetical protein
LALVNRKIPPCAWSLTTGVVVAVNGINKVRIPGLTYECQVVNYDRIYKTPGKGSKAWKEHAWERLRSVIA